MVTLDAAVREKFLDRNSDWCRTPPNGNDESGAKPAVVNECPQTKGIIQ